MYIFGGALVTLGELVSTAVSHQKLKIMKTNHSTVQGCNPKKAEEQSCEDSNTSYLARFSNFVS
jgi:hypothetical protein